MKILVENSTWNNIGDGWYQSALYMLIKKLYPSDEVLMGEGPIRRAFKIKSPRLLSNSLNIMEYQKADIHVFSGPMMKEIVGEYKNKIIEIKNRGAEYVFISGSGTAVSNSLKQEIGDFLKKYPPLFFSSRDEESFNNFSPFIKNSYNGICTAFLVNRMLPVDAFEMEQPFFISSFYRELEPLYSLKNASDPVSIENLILDRKKTYRFINFKYARHFNYKRPQQKEVGNHKIVRVIQDVNTRFNHINFSHPNSFISFNPLSYLAVTKSSEFVLSDRVHACAIGLAFNKPVHFLFNTPRAGIFDRLGFDYKVNDGIMYPNLDIIDDELLKLEQKIKQFI